MSNAGIPLRIIQEISGHSNLEQLQRYLEVKPDQVKGAIASLSMLSYRGKSAIPSLAATKRAWDILNPYIISSSTEDELPPSDWILSAYKVMGIPLKVIYLRIKEAVSRNIEITVVSTFSNTDSTHKLLRQKCASAQQSTSRVN